MNRHLSELREQGYTIVPQLFTTNEVQALRQVLRQAFRHQESVEFLLGRALPNAAVLIPELAGYIAHPKLILELQKLFRGKSFNFTSHCDLHLGLLSGWHKDDGTSRDGKGYFEEPAYAWDNCRVYKVGVYLQDHSRDSAGLSVRPGSHRHPDVAHGEDTYLPSRSGDAIIFDVRINHAGQLHPIGRRALAKWYDRVTARTPASTHKRMKRIAKRTYDVFFGSRMALFFTFGEDNDLTERFALNNMRRQREQLGDCPVILPNATRAALEEQGVGTFDDVFGAALQSG